MADDANLPAVIEPEADIPAAWSRVTDVIALRKEIARLERELRRAKLAQLG